MKKAPTSRRAFLRAASATVVLPMFESLRPRMATAGVQISPPLKTAAKRMVCIGNSFGMYPGQFFPEQSGADYEMTPLLQPLERHRKRFTVYSNLDHGLKGGHFTVHTYLSGVKHAESRSMPNGNITLDQRAAEVIAGATRFPSLTIGSETGLHGGCAMSWTRSGVRVPPITGPRELFRRLFVNEQGGGATAASDQLKLQGSILDAVLNNARSLQKGISRRDQEKLDEYFSSVRDVEKRLQQQEKWQRVSKPDAPIDEPVNKGLVEDIPLLYELVALALEVDASRILTLELAGAKFDTGFFGIKKGYHALSHHGNEESNINGLVTLEKYQTQQFAVFLDRLGEITIPGTQQTMLDATAVLFGSGMGNANSHINSKLPIVLAGGGYKLGEHRVLPAKGPKKVPLCNLYLSLLHRLGIHDESFGTSTGTFSI